ncbi:MAG: MotA/TolQ/ExbB proton channel family protein [Spirochaetes bacterium]|nr:MotA/TolQ/ExbB proton channel family protein [Spirochaetota bacterium]
MVESEAFTLLELFRMGGPVMWPLVFFSIAVVAISLERAIYILYQDLRVDDLALQVSQFAGKGKYRDAAGYLSRQDKRRAAAGILLALLKRGFNFLTAIGTLAPLTGFLGTVTGMIGAFRAIAEADDVNAQIVAAGIYEALVTTVFGLVIAIAAMIAHSALAHLVNKFVANVESSCSNLIAQLGSQSQKMRKAKECK